MKELADTYLKIQMTLFLISSCILNSYAQREFEWVRTMSETSPSGLPQLFQSNSQAGQSITTDDSGYVYTTGYFSGTIDFDPGAGTYNLTAVGYEDIFVAKHNQQGNLIWAKGLGGVGFPNIQPADAGYGIALDKQGNVYTTGTFKSTVDFDPGPGTYFLTAPGSDWEAFILKLDANGHFIWAKNMGGIGWDEAYSLIIDDSGNVYTTGHFADTADFDPGPGVVNLISQARTSIFISKLDSAGNFVWAKNLGGGDGGPLPFNAGYSIAADDSGHIYISGCFSGSFDIDPGPGIHILTSNGGWDIFIAKFDNNGRFIWAKSIGSRVNRGLLADVGRSITIDKWGDLYIAGEISEGLIDFDPGPGIFYLNSLFNHQDLFILKLNNNGDFIWAKRIGGPDGVDCAFDVATDAAGNVYATGGFVGTVDFDPGPGVFNLVKNDIGFNSLRIMTEIFILKLDTSGNFVWAKHIGGNTYLSEPQTTFSSGMSIALDASGNVYTTGLFSDTVDFDTGPDVLNVEATEKGIYIHKLACVHVSSGYVNIEVDASSYTLNGITYTTSGTYIQRLNNAAGCDSMLTVDLNLCSLIPEITVRYFTLGTYEQYDSYQWVKNEAIIAGATDSVYHVTENADYRVIVSSVRGCTDTSEVYRIINAGTGINDVANMAKYVKSYPNPATDVIYIESPIDVMMDLKDVAGKTILSSGVTKSLSLSGLASGVYLLRITDANGRLIKTEKILKYE